VILVDSSVLIDLFRGKRTRATDRLRQMEAEDLPFAVPLLCFQEVLQGARDEAEWRKLSAILETQPLIGFEDPLTSHRAAARIYFECRRRGLTVRSTIDCLVAQSALEHDALLLHDDDDYEAIALVRPLRQARA